MTSMCVKKKSRCLGRRDSPAQTQPGVAATGCVAVGRSQLVARGQRGNMLLIELKLKHIDVHRPAPSDMLMNLLPSSSF